MGTAPLVHYGYWATFRLDRNLTYEKRYKALLAAMAQISLGQVWDEPTSFWHFKSRQLILPVTQTLAKALDPRTDLLIVHAQNEPLAIVFGKVAKPMLLNQQMPYIKKLG